MARTAWEKKKTLVLLQLLSASARANPTSLPIWPAFMVVVAQTKVGFLTGGRGQKFRKLPEEERHTQEEEAYARATVALTRARKMCVIFCPLDMKGLIGAATVMGRVETISLIKKMFSFLIKEAYRHRFQISCPILQHRLANNGALPTRMN